jgi:hypothetical protein
MLPKPMPKQVPKPKPPPEPTYYVIDPEKTWRGMKTGDVYFSPPPNVKEYL